MSDSVDSFRPSPPTHRAGQTAASGQRAGLFRRALFFTTGAALWGISHVGWLAAGVVAAGSSSWGRDAACSMAEQQVNAAIQGTLTIQRCVSLNPAELTLEGIALADPAGRKVVRVGRIRVRPGLARLVRGLPDAALVNSVQIERPWVSLAEHQGELRLVTAVALREPSEEAPEPSAEPFEIQVRKIRVRQGAAVDLTGVGLPNGLSVDSFTLDASLHVEEGTRIELPRASWAVRANTSNNQPREFARFALRRPARGGSAVRMVTGERSDLRLAVQALPDTAELTASVIWGKDQPQQLRAQVRASASPALLKRIGELGVIPDATLGESLRGPVRLRADASGTLTSLRASVNLSTPGGALDLNARWEEDHGEAALRIERLDLAAVLPDAAGIARGEVRAEVDAPEGNKRGVRVHARDVAFDAWALPRVSVFGAVDDAGVDLHAIKLPHLTRAQGHQDAEDRPDADGHQGTESHQDTESHQGAGGHLRATGRVEFAGPVRIDLDARIPDLGRDPNLRRMLDDPRGQLVAKLRARYRPQDIEGEGELRVHGVEIPGFRAERLVAEGFVRYVASPQGPPAPELRVAIRGRDIAAGETAIERVALRADGGRQGYEVSGAVHMADVAQNKPSEAQNKPSEAQNKPSEAQNKPSGAPNKPRESQKNPRGKLALSVGVTDAGYVLSGEATASEILPSPLRVVIDDLVFDPEKKIELGSLTAESQELALTARASHRFSAAPGASRTEATLDLHSLKLEPLLSAFALPVARGTVSAKASFSGSDERPELHAEISAASIKPAMETVGGDIGLRDIHLAADWSHRDRRAEVQARVRVDGGGALRAQLAAELARRRDPVRALREGRFTGKTSVEDLPLETVSALTEAPPLTGTLSASASFSGTETEPQLHLTTHAAKVTVAGEGPLDIRLRSDLRQAGGRSEAQLHAELSVPALSMGGDRACRAQSHAVVRLDGALAGGKTVLFLDGLLDQENVLHTRVDLDTPIDTWLADGFPAQPPPIQIDTQIKAFDLEHVPVACAHAAGVVEGTLKSSGLFTLEPRVKLNLLAKSLRLGDQPPAEIRVRGRADAREASFHARVQVREQKGLRQAVGIRAKAPLLVDPASRMPGLGEGPLGVQVSLDRAPLALLVAAAPIVAQPEGNISGHLRLRGTSPDVQKAGVQKEGSVPDINARGRFSFRDVSFTLRDPFVRVDHASGAIALNNERVQVIQLLVRDGKGKVQVDGEVALDDWAPADVDVKLSLDDVPMRQEGVIFAHVDGHVNIDGDLDATPRRLDVALEDLSVALPEEEARDIQPLDQHEEVIYEDQPGFARRASALPPSVRNPTEEQTAKGAAGNGSTDRAEEQPETPPTVVRVRSEQPFWIRHQDFAVQLAVNLAAHTEAGASRVEGPVRVQRGFMDLFGTSFDFEPGVIHFAGAMPVDPTLDLHATHRLRSGHTVTVHISGHLAAPVLTFSSTHPNAQTDTDIIALLTGVRGREQSDQEDATEQATSMLAGITAGLVGSLARREFGQYVPVLAVESEGSADTTRVRAGVQADGLIPDAWRGVVRGMYVEGSVGGSEQEGQRTKSGFLIELLFPYDLTTTTTYEQPDNWSLDLLWEP